MLSFANGLSFKLGAALAAALLLVLLIHDRNQWKAKTQHYSEQLAAEQTAHAATLANVRAAAEQARREDSENLARVKSEQAAINERTANDFESRIADARARADRLRGNAQAAATRSGDGRAAPVPGLPAAAKEPFEGAGEDGLPDSDALIATEQAIQLDELIKWVESQHRVRSNGGALREQ